MFRHAFRNIKGGEDSLFCVKLVLVGVSTVHLPLLSITPQTFPSAAEGGAGESGLLHHCRTKVAQRKEISMLVKQLRPQETCPSCCAGCARAVAMGAQHVGAYSGGTTLMCIAINSVIIHILPAMLSAVYSVQYSILQLCI